MDKKSEVRAALLGELIKAIGSDRIRGLSVESIILNDPKEKDEDEDEEHKDEKQDKKMLKDLGPKPFSKLKE